MSRKRKQYCIKTSASAGFIVIIIIASAGFIIIVDEKRPRLKRLDAAVDQPLDVFGRVNHLGAEPGTQAYSFWAC